MSFEEFVCSEDLEIQVYTNNSHYRQLGASGWSWDLPTGMNEVKSFIDQMPWFYVCEFPQLSLHWFNAAFKTQHTHVPRDNVTSIDVTAVGEVHIEGLSNATLSKIAQLNAKDLALYRYAVLNLFDRYGRSSYAKVELG